VIEADPRNSHQVGCDLRKPACEDELAQDRIEPPDVRDLLEHGYEVLNVDVVSPAERVSDFLKVDLTDLGQTFEALSGADAVVQLAAIPAPGIFTEEVTFDTNVSSTYNVFTAATVLKLKRIVSASSETTLGLPFDRVQPAQAPMTRPITRTRSRAMRRRRWSASRWRGSSRDGRHSIVSLRFSMS
jgi:nucleoside-diphosphate-sugar epimerase